MCPRRANDEAALGETVQWYKRARFACEPFMFAAARFRTPWVDDEFAAAIAVSRQWLNDNPCPDVPLGQHFVAMLGAYSEMTHATVARVMELRVGIEEHVDALDRWKRESLKTGHPVVLDNAVPERRETGLSQAPRRRARHLVAVKPGLMPPLLSIPRKRRPFAPVGHGVLSDRAEAVEQLRLESD